jgi:threonine dehydrogenase-like Zn-dependent dehydrogenase
MWTVYLDTNPVRMTGTRVLGMASRRAYVSSPIALLRTRDIGEAALPGRRWVRVRNFVAGVSDDDVDLIHLELDPRDAEQAAGGAGRVYLGHEVVGEVVQIGPEVEFLRPGDRVAYQLAQCCATREIEPPCRHCAAGSYSLCENRSLPGPQAIGGGWGDEMVVHERQLFLVPDSLSDDQAALIEPCAVAVHTVLRHQPQPGDQVLVIGSAMAGLLAVQAVRALVPNALIAALPSETFQVEMAARMGTTRILYPEEGTIGVARMTGARHTQPPRATGARHTQPHGGEQLIGGFDIIYDTVGGAESIQNAMRWMRKGGTIVLSSRRIVPTELDLSPIWRKELNLLGALAHGTESWPRATSGAGFGAEGSRVSSFALASALVRERKLTPEKLVTHRFPLADVRRAVEVARNAAEHRAIKILLDVKGAPEVPKLPAAGQSTGRG